MVATMTSSPLPRALTSIAPPPEMSSAVAAVATDAGGGVTSVPSTSSSSPLSATSTAAHHHQHDQHQHHEHHRQHLNHSGAFSNGTMPHVQSEPMDDHGAVPVAVAHNNAHTHHLPLPVAEAPNSSNMMGSNGSEMMYSTPGMSSSQSPQPQTTDPHSSVPASYDYQAYQQAPTTHVQSQAPTASVAFAPVYDSSYGTTPSSYSSPAPVASHAPHLSPNAHIQPNPVATPAALPHSPMPASTASAPSPVPVIEANPDSGNSSGVGSLPLSRGVAMDTSTESANGVASPRTPALPMEPDAKMSLSYEAALILRRRHDSCMLAQTLARVFFFMLRMCIDRINY